MSDSRFADALESEEFSPGDVIVKQGEPGDIFYIIVSVRTFCLCLSPMPTAMRRVMQGDAEVRQKQADGSEKMVAELHPQDYFGEIALLTNR